MRLIDADKLQKAIPAEEDNITGMGMTYDEMEAYNDGIDEQWKKIVNAPTIEPERPKGKWIVTSEFEDCRYVKCNQCKVTQVFYYNKPLTNFCPNCGVDMRGKKDE